MFGEPLKYIWGDETFKAEDLPDRFIMMYPAGFRVFMSDGHIVELRHEGGRSGYVLKGGIRVGSKLDEVLAVYDPPKKTVQGKPIDWQDSDNVLYRDIEGRKGHDYYYLPDKDLRLWFGDDKLLAIYMTRSDYGEDKDDKPWDPEFARLLPSRVAKLNIDSADSQGVKEIFGEPEKYVWGNRTFKPDALPENYIMNYPCDFSVWMKKDRIQEIRFGRKSPYAYRDKLRIGASLEEAIELLGKPDETVQSQKNAFKDRVLYRDIDGTKGHCYYRRADQNVRLWFWGDKLIAIYMTRSDFD